MWSDGRNPRPNNLGIAKLPLIAGVVCAVFCVTLYCAPVGAVAGSSVVGASLRDNLPPALAITEPEDGATVDSPNVAISGTVHNVSQLMIYLDNEYYATVPLDSGAESFTLSVTVTTGGHTVKVVAIDPVTSTQVEASFGMTFVPPAEETPVKEAVDNAVEQVGGVVVGAGTELKSQVDQASNWGPMQTLTDAAFGTLRALDLVPIGGSDKITSMTGRFALVSAGLTLSVMPWSTYLFLGRIKLVPMRTIITPKVTGRLRIVGIILTVIPFLFMH